MAKENQINQVNLFCEGTVVVGDVTTQSDLRIDGTIQGKIFTTERIVVGMNGKIEGSIECSNIEIYGTMYGNINSKEVITLKPTAKLEGDIYTTNIIIEKGAIFNGKCVMNTNINKSTSKSDAKE